MYQRNHLFMCDEWTKTNEFHQIDGAKSIVYIFSALIAFN